MGVHDDGFWHPHFGAARAGGEVRFRVWAPEAEEVSLVAGDERVRMEGDGGVYEALVPVDAGTRYGFSLDGRAAAPDPASLAQPEGVHGQSMVVDTEAFEWHDVAWRGVPRRDLVIYELHTGTFTAEGTFGGVASRLGYLKRLGVTAVELMPVAQFPGTRDWGYDGVFPYAAQNTYGGAAGLARLVDAAHSEGLGVVLDVVYNHLGPEGNVLPTYAPYFTDRYATPWGKALNYDGPASDFVRRYFVENALSWVRSFHVDGLRLDAVHAIFDASPKHILQEIGEAVHGASVELGREVSVIAESDLNDPRVVKGGQECGYGMDAQWSDDLHHALHTAITGERFGYYQDYGLGDLARAYAEPFVLDGRFSRYRQRSHGAPSTGVPGERFVVFAQNHDQVGNRADGARLGSLAGEGGARTGAAAAILSPYIPLVFMGEEYGSRSPFYYFCDYSDPEVVRKTREGRRRELEGQGRPFVDPQGVEAFEASRPDHGGPGPLERERTLEYYSALIRFRKEHPAVRAPRGNVEVLQGEGAITVRRWEGDDQVLLLLVFSDSATLGGAPGGRKWTLALASAEGAPGSLAPGAHATLRGPSASVYVGAPADTP